MVQIQLVSFNSLNLWFPEKQLDLKKLTLSVFSDSPSKGSCFTGGGWHLLVLLLRKASPLTASFTSLYNKQQSKMSSLEVKMIHKERNA
jgi:hypothetical protein